MASLTRACFVPIHVRARSRDAWDVESIPVADRGPLEPFFAQSVERWLLRPASTLFRTVETEAELLARTASLPIRVAGLVMHMSHSGSTLVAQALAERERTVVLSEPGTLAAGISGPRFGDTPERSAAFIRATVLAQAAPFLPSGGDVVIKTEATQLVALPLLQLAFPEAQWAFLHRGLDHILAASLEVVSAELFPGRVDLRDFGLPPDLANAVPFEHYVAQLIAAIGTNALTLDATSRGLFVDHDTLTAARIESIAQHFAMPLDGPERARIAERLGRDAKDPGVAYVPRLAPAAPPEEVRALFASTRAALEARTHEEPA